MSCCRWLSVLCLWRDPRSSGAHHLPAHYAHCHAVAAQRLADVGQTSEPAVLLPAVPSAAHAMPCYKLRPGSALTVPLPCTPGFCLQATPHGVTNGILASVPGHPIWEEAMRRIHANWKRSPKMTSGSQGELTGAHDR